MSAQNMMTETVNPDGKWIYRVGGIASLAIGVIYIVIIALYASVGVQPLGGEARLEYLIGKTLGGLLSGFLCLRISFMYQSRFRFTSH